MIIAKKNSQKEGSDILKFYNTSFDNLEFYNLVFDIKT
jgi:hypothetical protein